MVYSNGCCKCSFEPEIIEIGQSSHNMHSNNMVNFQESTPILYACTKKVWKVIEGTTYDNKPHMILNCLQMSKISNEVINFIEQTIKTQRVELKLSWNKDPKRYIPRKCTITITICYNDEPDTQKMHCWIQT